ncbi:DUF4407 domain-containing protein [Sphingobacterium sp. SRCM116780]|uniref:DUF4407 domain-containing protein n=1 Tax=Sphingobacterium sp. SRCM116780 TaxID=2907623 RepID=UPI001F2DF18E|nr:DUF4407 domain-containing protein [Sphingobacterium sp. SRCM116780]UIR55573.1 DUF4407 domain-containing protein [Sphingobacterium sp. SRCM116780]
MKNVNHFFLYCAGVHEETLKKYPQELNKYVAIGATIFFTGLFAALSGGYAMYFVFSGGSLDWLLAIVFGIIWGLMIFNMDRYIVLSINKSKTGFFQLLQALPRILLAILIGMVISRPLELKIFDKEIRENLKTTYLANERAKVDTLNIIFNKKYAFELNQLKTLAAERDSLDANIKTDRQKLNYEIFGNKTTETSGVLGFGPYAKRKELELQRSTAYLDTLRSRVLEKQNTIREKQRFEGILNQKGLSNASLDSAVNLAGFADRNSALGNLKVKANGKIDQATDNAVTFIGLLFIFLECLPVFVKLLSGRDAYDAAIRNQKTIDEYESDSFVNTEKSAIDKLQDAAIDISINKRLKKMNEEIEEEV